MNSFRPKYCHLPQGVSVCPGEQLNLTCVTPPGVTALQWDINGPALVLVTRFISSGSSDESAASILTRSQTVFRFSRTSTSPLTSWIIVDNVSASVNGTRVECSDGGSLSTTTINVIRNGTLFIRIILCRYAVARVWCINWPRPVQWRL